MERIDARGLSCPQPVVLTKNRIDAIGAGEFEIIVDSAASRDNILRFAERAGWAVAARDEEGDIILVLKSNKIL